MLVPEIIGLQRGTFSASVRDLPFLLPVNLARWMFEEDIPVNGASNGEVLYLVFRVFSHREWPPAVGIAGSRMLPVPATHEAMGNNTLRRRNPGGIAGRGFRRRNDSLSLNWSAPLSSISVADPRDSSGIHSSCHKVISQTLLAI